MPYLLGIDNGGTMVKAGLYDFDGVEAALSSTEVPTILGKDGIVERDMNVLWSVNCKVIKDIIRKANIDPADIACISVSGHGNGLYLVDEAGDPLGNGIYSTDMRAKAYIENFEKTGVCDQIFPKTMQTLYPGQFAPLLAWMSDQRPDIISRTKWALGCIDYLRFRMTGKAYGEISNMSAAGVMDQNIRDYDNEILTAMGIGHIRDILPPIRQSCQVCGHVNAEAAGQTGLIEGTSVAGGMIDITACAIATGITDESRICLIAGTWSINEFISKRPLMLKGLLLTSVYCIDDYFMMTDGSMTSASNLEWFLRSFLESDSPGYSVYTAADEMLKSTSVNESEIIFLPFLFGTNADADAKSCFLGLCSWHSKAHMLRAVYEGIVFSHKMHIDKLLSLRDAPEAVRIAGGVVKSRIWLQMFADILQIPVEISSGTELGTMGAAMCAGVAAGVYSSLCDASKVFSKVVSTYLPCEENRMIYEEKYKRYQKSISCLSGLWKEW